MKKETMRVRGRGRDFSAVASVVGLLHAQERKIIVSGEKVMTSSGSFFHVIRQLNDGELDAALVKSRNVLGRGWSLLLAAA